ncbi:hypothetical protein J6590_060472 [Homalodisca vitripennis]|nr:hypothetical protein J6590_060472 [Homalodisca vitripennis]
MLQPPPPPLQTIRRPRYRHRLADTISARYAPGYVRLEPHAAVSPTFQWMNESIAIQMPKAPTLSSVGQQAQCRVNIEVRGHRRRVEVALDCKHYLSLSHNYNRVVYICSGKTKTTEYHLAHSGSQATLFNIHISVVTKQLSTILTTVQSNAELWWSNTYDLHHSVVLTLPLSNREITDEDCIYDLRKKRRPECYTQLECLRLMVYTSRNRVTVEVINH